MSPASQGQQLSRLVCAALVAGVATAVPAAQRVEPSIDLAQTLARVGERVEQWYARAQSVVSLETVWIQPLRYDLSPVDFPRRLAYELRVSWDPEEAGAGSLPEASVLRQVVAVNGRPPRPSDDPGCMDPKPVSPEPLAMLLASRREKFTFSLAGTTRVDGRAAAMIDYRSAAAEPADIEWRDNCVSVSLPGRARGRIWIDPVTHDVLRLDEHLIGQFVFDVPREHVRRGAAPSMVIERADSSIRYRRVAFQYPEETLMLPATIETVTVIRGGGVQRYRITQRFSAYRRFLTDGRIVPEN